MHSSEGVFGFLTSLGFSMIGRLRLWSAFGQGFKIRWLLWKGRTRCVGWKQRVDPSLVKSLYSIFEVGSVELFPTSVVWNPWVPSKVSFFAWEATWEKVLTLDQLERRGWSLANRCFLCYL